MELYNLETIKKCVWTPMKRDGSPVRKDDSAFVPSSSAESPPPHKQKYDVFLSFCGVDIRRSLLSHLSHGLKRRGIKVLIYSDLVQGSVASTLLTAIEESRFAIVILSPTYASSTWCLEELKRIVDTKEAARKILPLFYGVDPPDAQDQRKTLEAFTKHMATHGSTKVMQWRAALTKVANMPAWDVKNYESDAELVKDIVNFMWDKIQLSEIEFTAWAEASTSLSAAKRADHQWKYDVFLSFRAVDTKVGFLSHLYDELQNKGIKTFKDDEQLQKTTRITPSILMAIEESRFAIVLLSEEYASSIWCLNELTKVFQCTEDNDTILPVFYDVDPSDIQYQRGSFEVAFKNHEVMQDTENVEQWKFALKKVANLFGMESKDYETERKLVEGIVQYICSKVQCSTTESTKYDATTDSDHTSSGSKYDVFMSFRGEDTRRGIVSYLYEELQSKKDVKTFKDDEGLKVGMEITPALLTVIRESSFAIIVLSKNYASSSWCLEELTKIFEYMKDQNRILPLFYEVEPSDVRYQKKTFKDALDAHEKNHGTKKTKLWKGALEKVANLAGWDSKNFKTERELIKRIGNEVHDKVHQIPDRIESALPSGYFEAFEATTKAMNGVMEALEKVEVSVIAVYGIGGVGKTTMVKHVGARAKQNRLFHQVIMVIVPRSHDVIKIQGALADSLGLNLHEETEVERAGKLKKEILKRIESYNTLIILDGIRERIDLSSIGIPSYNKLQTYKTKILFTTMRRNVCHAMRAQAIITLNPLSKKDSWNLFQQKVRRSFDGSAEEICNVAMSIARECDGLPIALIAVARTLGDSFDEWKKAGDSFEFEVGEESKAHVVENDSGKWEEAVQHLQLTKTYNLDEDGDVFKCIKLSYDCLTREDVKTLLLLCCLFPEDDDIQIQDLIDYGLGEGLFRDSDSVQEASSTAHLAVKYLKACSFLLDGTKDGCVRVHDVVRDVALSLMLSEDGQGSSTKEAHKVYSGISQLEKKIANFPKELVCSKLQSLFAQSDVGIHSPETLRVLDDSASTILLLVSSFNLLTNLQALHLECCRIFDTSVLENLMTLEIRSMRKYPLQKMPKHIEEPVNLRKLNVTSGRGDTISMTETKSVFKNLQELHLLGVYWLKALSVGDLPPGSLCNLKFLKVEACHNLVNAYLPPTFHNIKALVVTCCIKLKSFFPVEVTQSLLHLEDLSVSRCPSIVRIIEASEKTMKKKVVFPKMKNLVLCNLPQLTWFYCTGSATIECPSLVYLHVQDCPRFSTSTSDFHTWKHVKVADLRHLRTIQL